MNPEEADELRARILDTLRRFKSRAVHVGELRGRLGLGRDDHAVLFQLLETMAEEHLVTQLPGGRFRLVRGRKPHPAASPPGESRNAGRSRRPGSDDANTGERNTRTGVLVINARGFGFVSTIEPGPDVFVPAAGLSTAMHGDKVRVRVRGSAKGLEGRVQEVVQRGTEYVGGQLHITARGAFIETDDDRVRHPVHLQGPPPHDAKTGQGVIARIVHYPEHLHDLIQAEIVETFDPKEFVAFETRRILLREGAIEAFSEDALDEARALPTSVPAKDKKDRVDLRDLDLVTIDPEDARDHDDAVYAERLRDGGFRIIVAIADVSHYVRPGSALDADALARGCTIYLPSHAIPMLPEEISSNLASLVANRDRLALAVEVDLGPAGAIRKVTLLEAVVRSRARLTYAGVARALGLTENGPKQPAAEKRLPLLQTLMDAAAVLGRKRRRRGSLEFDLPEAKVRLENETGRPIDVVRSRQDAGIRQAYNMIEELALLANEVVAAELTRRRIPTIYRIHPPPDDERLESFAQLATSLGFDLDVEAAHNPRKLSRFLAKVADTPHTGTLSYLLLRAMQQATYDTNNQGHFGLAAKEYLHFTSPIRRYPDMAVHRLVRKLARDERIHTKGLREMLDEQAQVSSKLERRAMQIEREVVDLYRAMLMQDRIGETFEATITGIAEHGIYASIDAPFVDVLCRLGSLPPDQWEVDPFGIRIAGLHTGRIFSLGDRLSVRIEDVSLARRRVSAIPLLGNDGSAALDGQADGDHPPHSGRKRRTLTRQEAKQRDRDRTRKHKERKRADRKRDRQRASGDQPRKRRR